MPRWWEAAFAWTPAEVAGFAAPLVREVEPMVEAALEEEVWAELVACLGLDLGYQCYRRWTLWP